MKLSELTIGQRATVLGWRGQANIRLMEMGVVPGAPIEVIRLAPLGNPMDVRIRRFHISIRKEDAETIEVEPVR